MIALYLIMPAGPRSHRMFLPLPQLSCGVATLMTTIALFFLVLFLPTTASLPYKSISLSQICADAGNESIYLEFNSTGGDAVALLNLGSAVLEVNSSLPQDNFTCRLELRAPKNHMLAIAYLRSNKSDTSCPFPLVVVKDDVGKREGLCEVQGDSSIPKMYPSQVVLVVEPHSWPRGHHGHQLLVNSLGAANDVCMVVQEQFPCNWKQNKKAVSVDMIFQPILCVSRHLACDNIINCPLSGADEVPTLCSVHSSHASGKFGGLKPTTPLLTQRIQESVAKIATNLAIHGTPCLPLNLSSLNDGGGQDNLQVATTDDGDVEVEEYPVWMYWVTSGMFLLVALSITWLVWLLKCGNAAAAAAVSATVRGKPESDSRVTSTRGARNSPPPPYYF